jgi:hypothetical protein
MYPIYLYISIISDLYPSSFHATVLVAKGLEFFRGLFLFIVCLSAAEAARTVVAPPSLRPGLFETRSAHGTDSPGWTAEFGAVTNKLGI